MNPIHWTRRAVATSLVPFVAALLCLCGVRPALAQSVHAGDVLVKAQSGALVTGRSVDGAGLTFPSRVFADTFGKLGPSLPNRTPDPGFNSVPGDFPASGTLRVTIRRAARKWTSTTGTQGHFCAIPAERVEIRKSGVTIVSPAADPASFAGPSLTLGFADSTGLLHEHPVYWLTTPFSAGVYLVELGLSVDTPGVSPSDPFWIVLAQDASTTDVDNAVAWLLANVANTPGPGGNLCPPTTPTCPADWNNSGAVTVTDIFDFLTAFFAGNADFNNSGATSVSDIFDFLSAYFTPC